MTPQEARTIANYLIADLEHEIPLTVRVIEAAPADKLHYQPDPKASTGIKLIQHITQIDEWFLNSIANGAFSQPEPLAGADVPADAAAVYKQKVPAALARIKAMSDEQLAAEMDFFGMMKLPAAAVLGIMIKHSVHHRGQLSTYLRSMGGKVPGIYGPSADSEK